MLAAVQIFNNPIITFKSESFIVLSVISWTYLLHAYYKENGVEYKYRDKNNPRRFQKTAKGAHKYWELERCINCEHSPLDKPSAQNLRFLIGIRHEIEHRKTSRIDDYLSAKFQACCINYNTHIKQIFGDEHSIDRHLSVSLQLSSISEDQADSLRKAEDLPKHIQAYVNEFEMSMTDSEHNDSRFSYGVYFVKRIVNHKGQADRVIEFIPADSEAAKGLNREQVAIREKEKQKFLPKQIVTMMQSEGFERFSMHTHTQLWKSRSAKDDSRYGCQVVNQWYWYKTWVDEVRSYCKQEYPTSRPQPSRSSG